jgi:hypothetical protein
VVELEIRVSEGMLEVRAPGTDWHQEVANTLLVVPNLRSRGGVIHAVGTYAAAARAELAQDAATGGPVPERLHFERLQAELERAVDVTPFPDGPLDLDTTAAAIHYFSWIAWRKAQKSWRQRMAGLYGSQLIVRLIYPGWQSVPAGDRAALVQRLAGRRGREPLEFWVNGRLLMRRRRVGPSWRVADP